MGQYNYVFNFPSELDSTLDPVVGPYITLNQTFQRLTVFDTGHDSVSSLSSYWCLVYIPALQSDLVIHPNFQFLLDQQLQTILIDSLIPPLDTDHLCIITYYAWPYMLAGLKPHQVTATYTTEDGVTPYTTEDALNNYVQEPT